MAVPELLGFVVRMPSNSMPAAGTMGRPPKMKMRVSIQRVVMNPPLRGGAVTQYCQSGPGSGQVGSMRCPGISGLNPWGAGHIGGLLNLF